METSSQTHANNGQVLLVLVFDNFQTQARGSEKYTREHNDNLTNSKHLKWKHNETFLFIMHTQTWPNILHCTTFSLID